VVTEGKQNVRQGVAALVTVSVGDFKGIGSVEQVSGSKTLTGDHYQKQ
jgi:hypothetical protein